MEIQRSYILRGTPDCPIAVYYRLNGAMRHAITHWHPELELMLVTEGAITYRMGKDAVTMYEGDILVIPPGTIHGPQAATPALTTWTIIIAPEAVAMNDVHVFQKNFVAPLQDGRLIMPMVLHPGDPAHEALYPAMSQLYQCKLHAENYKMKRFAAAVAICTALYPFCQAITATTPTVSTGHRAVKDCIRYIHWNYARDLTLAQLADYAHLQPNYLCALFKEHTGQTVMEQLTQIRVDAAAFLLRNSDLSIAQVAERSGFRSESAFFRRFKELMGQTPKSYRRGSSPEHPETEPF